ncbi:MAG: bifunctional proline dehydrogenase/L-glutamate gamma-semialdehyde dehydrogenase [Deltaproteobacteria bacterium]|nr:bifunctional proline dehydrogenase/L-glutamate gamma-semialdehyde dehydrogenase [Deltaproteobacteria bacterium]
MPSVSAGDPVARKGMEIFRLMAKETPPVFDRKRWAGEAMRLAMENPDLKVRLFRFVDVLPALAAPELVVGHAREYFLSGDSPFPNALKVLLSGAAWGIGAGLAAAAIRKNVESVAKHFIVGEDPAAAVGRLKEMWEEGRPVTVDLLGEAVVSETEADRYRDLYVGLVGTLAEQMARWPAEHAAREAHFPRLNVSVKISSLSSRIGPANHEDSVLSVKERLRPIFRRVKEAGGSVTLDMEMYSLKRITLDVFTSLLAEPEFAGWPHAGIALQAYLKDAVRDLRALAQWARERRRRIAVRLVKGAYWEYENIVAGQKGWPVPVFAAKPHTDWTFERCVEEILSNADCFALAAGTHNVRSIAKTIVFAEERGIPPEGYEIQMLYGMAEPIRNALRGMGIPVREYAPIGELLPGMAYLVRRLLENTSNEGFLRKTFAAGVSPEELLSEPEAPPREAPAAPVPVQGGPFANEPPVDFSIAGNRAACRAAIDSVRGRLGKTYPVVIEGKEYRMEEEIVSRNPARPSEVVGIVSGIDRELGERAVAAARRAQERWGRRKPEERAEVLFRAAEIARRRRMELLAWQVLEVGKGWTEADADVTEAIDYLEYYGREMIRLGRPVRMGDCPGEDNRYFYRPRGVGVVIAPWNFPLAISAGMVSAALVTGNAVLYKPSSLSPVNGRLACSLLWEAGVPEGVLNFVPGRGEVAGGALVEHKDIDFVLFTGSREVGLGIVEKAGRTVPGQRGVKRAVTEMGGKNAIIVDEDADLDMAVPGVVQSAFGYQGQKCSACSRAIVLAACYDRFLSRLVEAVRGLSVGPPEDPARFVGPVVDAGAKERVLSYLEIARREGRVAVEIPVPAEGHYVSPTVITDLPRDSRVLREEIFGPVLAVIRAEDLEEAVRVANDSDYALTGGLFSRSPAAIERVREAFAVGNLYINRGITGAIVGRQPFGGFKLSGVGSKAGGFDYLLQFLEPRVVTENTMRRGFSPDVLS